MRPGISYLFFCLFFLTTRSTSLFAQIPANAIEGTTGLGMVIRNHPDFPEIENPAYNGSISLSKHFKGQKPWHRYYNYPRMGVSINGGSLGSNFLGNYLGIMAEMTFEKRLKNDWFWGPRLSLGSAWFSDPYDEEKNQGNVAIGSEFTFLAGAELFGGKQLSDQIDLIMKVGIIHASNSHFKLPNVGLNLPLVSVGLRYHWKEKKPLDTARDTSKMITCKKIRSHVRFAVGVNEYGSATGPVNGPKYLIYLATYYVSKMYSPVNKVTIGIEGWYNKGSYDFIVSQEFYENDRRTKSCAAAIVLGHEFLMGHFGLITTGGIYLYNPFYKDRMKQNEVTGFKDQLKSIIPLRLGVQYYLNHKCESMRNNIFVGLYIKTNFGQADFLESGIGYMF